jgi:hypothetical protein
MLTEGSFRSEIRWLLQAGLLIFLLTVAIGILNGFHFTQLSRQVLLTHVHGGTLGWITLGVLAICLALFGQGAGPSAYVRNLSWLAAVGIPLYVLAFLSGNLPARAIFGVPVLIAIVGLLVWLIGRLPQAPMTVPRFAVLGGIATLVIGSTIGVLLQIELATKNVLVPGDPIIAHAGAQVTGYLVLVGMGIAEWQLRGTNRLTWPGAIQVALLFVGGMIVVAAGLVNNPMLAGAFIPVEIIALGFFLVRVGPGLAKIHWTDLAPLRHFGAAGVFIVVNVLLTVAAIAVFVSSKQLPFGLLIGGDHAIFVGVMTNSLFGLLQLLTADRRTVWPWADQLIFWGMNVGVAGFILTLATSQQALEKFFTPLMGAAILLAILTYSLRLRPAAGIGSLRQAPAGSG